MESQQTPKKKKSKPKKPKSEDGSSSNETMIIDEPLLQSNKSKMTSIKTPQPGTSATASKKRKKRDSASSDEERWLTAIESGKLEDVDDELKKIKPKDPALMTARQRAMYDRGSEGNGNVNIPTLMSLPTGYKEKVMTAEAIQKAAIKSLKRKQLADEKREKDKKKTMERLLKKQDSKAAKQAKIKVTKSSAPVIVYKQNADMTIINFPHGFDYPLGAMVSPTLSKVTYCGMGCGNPKKYSCSQTGVPLCSLGCYKQNISRVIF